MTDKGRRHGLGQLGEPLEPGFRELLRALMEEHIPFNKLLGMKVGDLKRGVARIDVPFREELVGDPTKPALHGGVLSALADTVGGFAVFSMIEPGSGCSTIDLRVDYLRPGRLEDLHAEARVVRVGGRVAVASISIHQSDPDSPIVVAMGVYNVKRAAAS